jgi:hypothetical protein
VRRAALLPLTVFLPLVAWRTWRDGWSPAVVVAVVVLAVLTAAPKKRPHYLLPAYPFLVLSVAEAIEATGRRALRQAAVSLSALALLIGPLFYARVLRFGGPPEDPKLAAAREVLAAVEPGRPIVCLAGLAEEIAFVGRRDGIGLVKDRATLAARARANGVGSYVIVPDWDHEPSIRRVGRTVDLEPVVTAGAAGDGDGRAWPVYRVRGLRPGP